MKEHWNQLFDVGLVVWIGFFAKNKFLNVFYV